MNLVNNNNETALNAVVTFGNVDTIVKLMISTDGNITNNSVTVLNYPSNNKTGK